MKSIILSDIDHENKGIIPWSLRFAKAIKSKVNVIHVIDTRDVQGIYTPYSDSKSVTIQVESFEEKMEKEKKKTHDFLSKHVGREVSMLDYPLSADYEVKIGHLDELIIAETKKPGNSLLMLSARPHGKAWSAGDDIFFIVAHSENPVLIIPPGEYSSPGTAFFISNMEDNEPEHLKKALNLMNELHIQLVAASSTVGKTLEDKIKNHKNWEKIRDNINGYSTLENDDPETILASAKKQEAGMIILFEKKRNILQRIASKSLTEKLAKITTLPLLVFYN